MLENHELRRVEVTKVGWRGVLVMVGVAVALAGRGYADESGNGNGRPWKPVLEVWKAQRQMHLRDGDQVVREFTVVLGRAPRYPKEQRGDMRTPVGRYAITEKHVSRFHRFLGLSYPNFDDAERGYQRGLIGARLWADLFFANLRGDDPPARTPLGGRIGIHGFGNRPYAPIDWTEGCIAISNDEIEYLYETIPVGTLVVINE